MKVKIYFPKEETINYSSVNYRRFVIKLKFLHEKQYQCYPHVQDCCPHFQDNPRFENEHHRLEYYKTDYIVARFRDHRGKKIIAMKEKFDCWNFLNSIGARTRNKSSRGYFSYADHGLVSEEKSSLWSSLWYK
jgi:hypothetical protein